MKPHSRKVSSGRTISVNLEAVTSISYACSGCATKRGCCCARYEVCVDRAEMERINGLLPAASDLCPHLKTRRGYDNVFENAGGGLYAIDTHSNGLCVFAYKSRGKIRCALHTLAVRLGLPVALAKPRSCLLWPMSVSDNGAFLTVCRDAFTFRCVRRRMRAERSLSPALAKTIETIYGKTARSDLERKALKGMKTALLKP